MAIFKRLLYVLTIIVMFPLIFSGMLFYFGFDDDDGPAVEGMLEMAIAGWSIFLLIFIGVSLLLLFMPFYYIFTGKNIFDEI